MAKTNERNTDHDYAHVEFRCDHGHKLRVQAVMSDGVAHLHGAEWVQWIDGPEGGKFRTRCEKCGREGRRADLQASWPKLLDAMRRIEPDPTTGTIKVTLGGRVG